MIPDGLGSPRRRRWLFALLYAVEGAPVGYLWTALPTRLRIEGVSVAEVAALGSLLTLPWTLKFLWAPLVDGLRSQRFGLRPWILAAQIGMALTLLPLLTPGTASAMQWLVPVLLVHALCAATQDVAIDALAVQRLTPTERGRATGWMQMGNVLGKAAFGGVAVALEARVGTPPVVGALIAATLLSGFLVLGARDVGGPPTAGGWRSAMREVALRLRDLLSRRTTWAGMLLAASLGTAMEALAGLAPSILVDGGVSTDRIGSFFVVAPILGLGGGSLVGGWLADRFSRRRAVAGSAIAVSVAVASIASLIGVADQPVFLAALFVAWGTFGLLTASLYAMLMDLVDPALGGTQFSAYMGGINLCYVWSVAVAGALVAPFGYASTLVLFAVVGLAPLLLLPTLDTRR